MTPLDLESLRGSLASLEFQIAVMDEHRLSGHLRAQQIVSLRMNAAESLQRAASAALAELTARRARDAEVGALVAAARRAEVSFNTVGGCYERNPGNFMMAMRELEQDVVPLRAALLPFQRSDDKGDAT